MPRPPRIHEEIHQSRPFPTLSQEATVTILRTAAVVRRAVARAVEPAGISVAQYNVLRILRGAGREGLATLAIRDRMVEEAPGVTRLLDKLEAAGLVRRDRPAADRRQVVCAITQAGLALLDRLEPGVSSADQAVSASMDAAELARLVELLDALRAGVASATGVCSADATDVDEGEPEPADRQRAEG